MGTSDTEALEKYISSQPALDWHEEGWSPDASAWARGIISDARTGAVATRALMRLYFYALELPGYDYRLAWLPKLEDLLPCLTEGFEPSKTFDVLSTVGTVQQNTSPLRCLMMIAPLSGDEIQRRSNSMLRAAEPTAADALHGLLANPNAPADWLEELYFHFQDELRAKRWSPLVSPKSLISILRNPSVSSHFISAVMRGLFTQNGSLMRNSPQALNAIAWNPATTPETISEFFPGGMINDVENNPTRIRMSFPWRGNLSREAQQRRQFSPNIPATQLSKVQIDELQKVYLYNHQVMTWLDSSNPNGSDSVTGDSLLAQENGPNVFVSGLDRFYLDPSMTAARSDISASLIRGEVKGHIALRYATFWAKRLRQREEMVGAFEGGTDGIPLEWVDALI